MARIIIALLCLVQEGSLSKLAGTCADKKSCHDIHTNPPNPVLLTKRTQNEFTVSYQCAEDTQKYTAKLTCIDSAKEVNGTNTLTCKNNTWTPSPPKGCVFKVSIPTKEHQTSKKSETWKYITGGAGGGAGVILVIIIVTIILIKKSRNGSTASKEHLSKSKDKTWIHRVWTVQRSRKKALVVLNLAQLREKAGNEFGYNDAKIVLEEDGTCIENDESLQACADRVLVALDKGQQWTPVDKRDNYVTRVTYDVCSCDGGMRKLVLAVNLKDLKNQCSLSFKYPVERICLEEDGTVIEDDNALIAMSNIRLMALGRDHVWSEADPGYNMPNGSMGNSYDGDKEGRQGSFHSKNKYMYKVWSEDHSQKKIVLAGDLVDLHLQCTKVLALQSPIKIFPRGRNEEITDDKVLAEMKDQVLIVVRPKSSYTPEPVHYSTVTDNWNGDSHVNGNIGHLKGKPPQPAPRRTPDSTMSHCDIQVHQRPLERANNNRYDAWDIQKQYSTVTPSECRNQQNQQNKHRHSNEMFNLPYSDLRPHHRESRKLRGSTDEVRSDSRQINDMARTSRKYGSFSHGSNMETFELSERPYIASGDALQSKHSDVLF